MVTKRRPHMRDLFKMNKRQQQARRNQLGQAIWREWRRQVRALPWKYQQRYRQAMQFHMDKSTGTVSMSLSNDTYARSIEYGYGTGGVGTTGAYDLRTTLLRPGGKSVRVSKSGHRYLHVPFRRTVAQIRGLGGHAAYAAAKKLSSSFRPAQGKTLWGSKLSGDFHRELRGIYRFPRVSHKSGGAIYKNFRTISTAVLHGWRHPGIKAHRLIRKVARKIPQIARTV